MTVDVQLDGQEQSLSLGEFEGVLQWSVPAEDPSTSAECSTFDFDADGRDEHLVLDQDRFAILRGTDGAVLFEDRSHPSGTWLDTPVVVDLDGDGSVEILVSGYSDPAYFPGSVPLRAYTNAKGTWPGGSSWWPEQTWSGTSREADGSIPRTARAPWLVYDHWRAQPETFPDGANLSPSVVDACATRCDGGTVTLPVRIANGGPDELPADTPFAVYGVQDDGSLDLLEIDLLPDWLDDGWTAPTVEVTVSTGQALRGLRLVAGDDGTGVVAAECDVSDNVLDWAWAGCADR